jgi:hypothetical protein
MIYDSMSTDSLASLHANWELGTEQVRQLKDVLRQRYDADLKSANDMRCAQCVKLMDGTCPIEENEADRRHYVCNIHVFCPNF